MSQAKKGDKVKIHYKGSLDDGSVFDSSEGKDPLKFTLGDGSVIPGFESAVLGMEIDEEKTVNIPSEEAYGSYRDDLVVKVEKSNFPDNITPELGQKLSLKQPDGGAVTVTITEIEEEKVTLDANHPLAGQNLNFKISLVEIG